MVRRTPIRLARPDNSTPQDPRGKPWVNRDAAVDAKLCSATNFRAAGSHSEILFAIGQCSLGSILVAASARGVCAISLGDNPDALAHELQDRFSRARLIGGDAKFEEWLAKIVGFVDNPATGLDLPLDIRGTAFQQRVWQALRDIPPGSTATYTDVARRIGTARSARAVARACATNVLPMAIPCIAWSAQTAACPVIAGASSANVRC